MLHFAFVMVAMCFTIVFRNQVLSMVTVICMCMNVLTILYGFVDKMIADMGIKGFQMIDYTVGGKMMALPMKISGKFLCSGSGFCSTDRRNRVSCI